MENLIEYNFIKWVDSGTTRTILAVVEENAINSRPYHTTVNYGIKKLLLSLFENF